MIHIIVNPIAGNGYALKLAERVESYLSENHFSYRIHHTERAGHATQLARKAAESGAERVFGVGGDGTIKEIAEGLIRTSVPLGIVPGGTGNDFARTIALPKDFDRLMQALTRGEPRKVDVGLLNGKVFLNIIGAGFDVEVLRWSLHFKRFARGIIPYFLGVLLTIFTHKDVRLNVRYNGERRRITALLIAIANGQCYGGGMQVAKPASVQDGLLNIIIIHPVSRLRIPFLLPHFLKGTFFDKTPVDHTTVKQVTLEGNDLYLNVDGEIRPYRRANIELSKHSLYVLA